MKLNEPVKIFPGAQVIGDVEIGENCSIWHGAVIRGDVGPIRIGKNSNVQDNCVLHTSANLTLRIGDNVSIGHGAVVHGCEIDDNVLIGMNATVLNGAKIGSENKVFPENSLILGVPGKLIKETTQEQRDHIIWNASHYVELANEYDE